ncbi:MAG TPA: elongation factor P maturation arginine rhamnosyltransferase EarP, partial [Burkholderiaceae bacterium]|nr:elongation factor P maturation arginine rhamnosyltransferase EarP [Burkholderiaceae bacterium]
AARGWRLLLPEGTAPDAPAHPAIRRVPFLPQRDWDRLLWSCGLNLVRGEDSLVRALWAGRPMLWQAYRQPERAERPKLAAFADRWLGDDAALPAPAARAFEAAQDAWNLAPDPAADAAMRLAAPALLDALPALDAHAERVRGRLGGFPDAVSRLVSFAVGRL